MDTLSRDRVEGALDPLKAMLGADGYDLDVGVERHQVNVRIVATPEACEECLVPRNIMEPMIAQMLEDGGVVAQIQLRYPDSHHEA